jgi:O-antigen/teichoic acid export membrane protein
MTSPEAAKDAEGIARSTAFGVATQATTAVFTAGLTLYLIRSLGAADYGVFALAVGIGALLVMAADFGISSSAGRFIAEHRGDREGVAALLADAFRLKLAAAVIGAVVLAVAAGPIADVYGNADLAWPLRAVALAVFGQSMMLLFRGAFVAMARVALTWRLVLLENVFETSASIALVLAGGGAAGAAFGRAAGYMAGAAIGVYLAWRALGRTTTARATSGRRREIARYAGAMVLVNAAFTLFERIDVLLIGAIISTTAVGVFEAPLRLSTFLSYAGQAVAFGVAPRVARHRRHGSNVAVFERAVRYLIVLQAALLAPTLVWSEPIVHLALGAGYEQSSGVLRALAPFIFLSALGTFITLAVNYLGEARRRVPLAAAAVLLNLVIDLVLIPEIGVVGGAIGTDVAFTLYVVGHFWITKQVLGLPLRPVALTLARCLAGAGAMAATLALFGTAELSVAEALVGGAAGLAVYFSALLASGEISQGELAAARRVVAGRRPQPAQQAGRG